MHFCSEKHHRHVVRKARSKRKVSHSYEKTVRLSNGAARELGKELSRAFRKFRDKIDVEALEKHIKNGSPGHILAEIDWAGLPDCFEGFVERIQKLYADCATSAASGFRVKVQKAKSKDLMKFDANNPRIKDFISKETGARVADVQSNTQKIVQQAVLRGSLQNRDEKWVAKQIKNSIGLDPRREMALANYANSLYSSNMDPNKADALVDKYGEKLLNQRAETIARTETRQIANYGQLEVWTQMVTEGVISEKSRKVWVVDGNPCELCDPMDEVAMPLSEPWILLDGTVCDVPSDSHPNCMCGMDLDFIELDEADDE
jgi:hypothetical protein